MIGNPTVVGDIAEVVGPDDVQNRGRRCVVCEVGIYNSIHGEVIQDRGVRFFSVAQSSFMKRVWFERVWKERTRPPTTMLYMCDEYLRPIRDLDEKETEVTEEVGLVV